MAFLERLKPCGGRDMVELVYSVPKIQLCVDGVVDRNKTDERADWLYLVVDYAARSAWIEAGTPLFFAPEAEDGAGSVWKISNDFQDLDIDYFLMGLEHILYKEISRPGSEFDNIELYCKRVDRSN
jgi:hypothetical protein